MESSRSLSPLESGGWPFGTERSSSHPALDTTGASLNDLFGLRLKEGGSRSRRDSKPERSRELDIRNSEPSERAARKAEEPTRKRMHTHKNARNSESLSEAAEALPQTTASAPDADPNSGLGWPGTEAPAVAMPELQPGALAGSAPDAALDTTQALPTVSAPGEAPASATGSSSNNRIGASAALAARASTPAPVRAGGTEGAVNGGQADGKTGGTPSKNAARSAAAAPAPEPEINMERTASIFRQLRMQLTPSTRHAVIHLVPAELGRIAIHLTVRGGKVSGEIRADKAETLAILEAHEPELRAAFEQLGMDSADLQLARHGDPSSGRSDESTSPLSDLDQPKRERMPEVASEEVLSILREDRVDTLA